MGKSLADPDPDQENRKRKAIAQGQKACNMCRLRKVKCSFELPCQTCTERQHPELCTYDPPLKRLHLEPSASSAVITPSSEPWVPSREDWEQMSSKVDRLENTLQLLRSELARKTRATASRSSPSTSDEGVESGADLSRDVHAKHPLTGDAVYLGAN